jgi:hypothetical protein
MAHIIRDARTERLVGYGLVIAGLYLVYDAYEKRGTRRPFLARLLPG